MGRLHNMFQCGGRSQVLEAHIPSGHADASTSAAHASPSSSSCRRKVSPTYALFPPFSRMRQISPIQVPEIPESSVVPEVPESTVVLEAPPTTDTGDDSERVPPPTTDVVESVPPLNSEVTDPKAFRGDPIDLSLLPIYPDHTVIHIWDREMTLDRDLLKFINHMRKITGLPQPNEYWFQAALLLFGMKDLCMIGYITVNHGMLNAFVER
ncbi:uncharacterized protein LOC127119812 [Lathyrus oleraceus]|uniref:uncharacterized protein LOC127119812 n=1 Tax=Pisum sativum TaxID=3888 RepID=UPI0021CF7D1F|nr:uncharacterized protein LOC127119812 [Pisum sativum]XP_050906100.1 uncharacterized protein LOC127119812 [Pisum sativum]